MTSTNLVKLIELFLIFNWLMLLVCMYKICYKLNIIQYKINETYTIIKQTPSTITESCTLQKKRTRYKQRVKSEGKNRMEKRDNYYNTNTLFNLT